jgi:hypothetical protein
MAERSELCTVKVFFDEHRDRLPRGLVPTFNSLRHLVQLRHRNGLLSAGAVIEGPVALLINPDRFLAWLTQPATENERAA